MTISDGVTTQESSQEESASAVSQQWKVDPPKGKSSLPILLVVGCSVFAVFALVVFGILAVIAVPNFIAMATVAKRSEAPMNLDAIRATEMAYYSEFDEYFSAGPCPSSPPGRGMTPFEGPCAEAFSKFGWSPETSTTRCQYTAKAIPDGAGDRGFLLTARCDLDEDGVQSVYEASLDSPAKMMTKQHVY